MRITEYKNIIWDWNGTLFDDVWLCAEIMNNLLKRRFLEEISFKKYRDIFTFPVKDYYIDAGHNFQKESFEIIGKEFMDEYEMRKTECQLYPYTIEVLKKLKELNLNQYLLSAYKQESLRSIVEKYGLKEYFIKIRGLDHIYADGKVDLGKDLMNEISKNGQIDNTLFIGDTLHDLEVARTMGAECLLISAGHQSETKLNSSTNATISSMNSLYSILLHEN